MRIFLILFSICISIDVSSQIEFYDCSNDTLKSSYQTMGNVGDLNQSTEKFDQSFISSNRLSFYLGKEYLSTQGTFIDYCAPIESIQKTSALPHIGFGYFFGSQGAQNLSFEYDQVLPKNWLINANIKTSKLEGYFRNTAYAESRYGLSLSKKTEKFGLIIQGTADKINRDWSGGVLNDSLLDFFSPQFIPVLKENCNSTLSSFQGSIQSYFKLFDSQKLSLSYINETSVFGVNRLFNEVDTLKGIYENNFFDTITTRDQYQHSTADHFSGVHLQTESLSYGAGAKAIYWNYRNMGLFRDTVEVNLEHRIKLKLNQFDFEHYGTYNLLGAFNGFQTEQSMAYQTGSFTYFLRNKFGKKMPQVRQRFYSANNTFYNNPNMDLELYSDQELGVNYRGKGILFSLFYHLGIHRDIYYFDTQNLNWTNVSTLSDNVIHQIRLKGNYSKGNLIVRQSYTFTSVDDDRLIIPQHYLNGSLDYRMGLFKDKKMEVILGLTYSLSSKTHVVPLIENIGVYDFLNIDFDNKQKGLFNLGVYSAFEIETFRFFLKVNNLGYLWNDLQWNYIEGIYLPEVTVRIGVTWDFWN